MSSPPSGRSISDVLNSYILKGIDRIFEIHINRIRGNSGCVEIDIYLEKGGPHHGMEPEQFSSDPDQYQDPGRGDHHQWFSDQGRHHRRG